MAEPAYDSVSTNRKSPQDSAAESLDAIVAQFRRLWTTGDRPDVHAFLGQSGPMTPERLLAILEIDQRQRWKLGEQPSVESYLGVYPMLAADRRTFSLVLAEMYLRQAEGEPIVIHDWRNRFPQFGDELRRLADQAEHASPAGLAQETTTESFDGTYDATEVRTLRLRPDWVPAREPAPADMPSVAPATDIVHMPPRPLATATELAVADAARIRQIGPYRIEQVLSHGGMGIIYKALDTRLKRTVALKMVLSGSQADQATLARFRAEAEAVARLQHPNIVQIFEVGEHEGQPYLALEFVNGKNLQQVIATKPFTPQEAAALVATLARAVEFAHHRGIIHRDIKPGNILISAQGVPKITDFGLAKFKGSEETHSRPGEVIGTPNYMAPEQADGDPNRVGPVSDVYSLGAVLYELLTGQPPFHGASPMETLLRLRINNPIPPRYFKPRLALDLEKICLKCLEKERHERYHSAERLADELQRFLDGRPIEARKTGPIERLWKWTRRHPAIALLTIMMAGYLVLSQAMFFIQWQQMRETRAGSDPKTANDLTDSREEVKWQRWAVQEAQKTIGRAHRQADWTAYLAAIFEIESGSLALDPARSQALLDQCDSSVRGWEWYYLRRRAEGSALTTQMRPGQILALQFAPNEKNVLTLTTEGKLVQLRSATGEIESELKLGWEPGHSLDRLANRAEFAQSGRKIVAEAEIRDDRNQERQRVIGVWDVSSGECERYWPAETGSPLDFALRDDGKRLAVATGNWVAEHGQFDWRGGDVKVVDVESGKLCWQSTVPENEPSFRGVAFIAQDNQLAVSRPNRPIEFRHVEDGSKAGQSAEPMHDSVSLCVHPHGAMLGAYGGRVLYLFDPHGKSVGQLSGHSGNITGAAFSDNGRLIITSSADHTIRTWDVATLKTVATLSGHTLPVVQAALGQSSRKAASFATDGQLKVWDLSGETSPNLHTSGRDGVRGLAAGPEGKWLVTGNGDGQIGVWDTSFGHRLKTYRCPSPISCMALSTDGTQLAVGSESNHDLFIMDPMTGEIRQRLHPGHHVLSLAFSPNGQLLLVTGDDGMAEVWNVASATVKARGPEQRGAIAAGAFSPRGDIVATGGLDGTICVWDSSTGFVKQTINAHSSSISCLVFSPDGANLASANQTQGRVDILPSIKIWDAATGELKRELKGHDQSISCLAYYPDGSRLASGGQDRTIRIWDGSKEVSLLTLTGDFAEVRGLAFASGGRVLATAHGDPCVRIWDATPLREGPGVQARFQEREK
jgi:WD40 repeat protein